MCMSPPCVCPLRVVSLPCVCFFFWLFLSCVCYSMYMFLRVHVPSVFMSLHVYIPFVCLSLRAYVPLYDCCWNSNSSNKGLVRRVSGVHKLTFVPTEARVCDEFVQALRTVKGRFASHLEVEPSFLTTVFMSLISSQLTLWLSLNNRKIHDRQRWEARFCQKNCWHPLEI